MHLALEGATGMQSRGSFEAKQHSRGHPVEEGCEVCMLLASWSLHVP